MANSPFSPSNTLNSFPLCQLFSIYATPTITIRSLLSPFLPQEEDPCFCVSRALAGCLPVGSVQQATPADQIILTRSI